MPIHLDPLGTEKSIPRQFRPPITSYNTCRYPANRYPIHQLVHRPTGVLNRLMYRALYLTVIAIDINRLFHTPVGQTIGIDRQFHVPIGHSNTQYIYIDR